MSAFLNWLTIFFKTLLKAMVLPPAKLWTMAFRKEGGFKNRSDSPKIFLASLEA